jgi:dephospho-CoA kinase
MILGITGGLGCGKSTAAALFAQRGFKRLDFDAVVREEVLVSAEVRAAVRDRFGPSVMHPAGEIDRSALGALVFADPEHRIWLENLTHPRVFAIGRRVLADDPDASWAIEVPLLFEKSLENWFDFTVCVGCDPALQLVRLEQRGLNRALAGQRISTQLPLARKVELSDFVLWNEGSLSFLKSEVDRIVDSPM